MVREAEEHAAEDKARRESAEVRNNAEQLAYSIEKLIKDNDDKLPDDVKTEVQADVDALKTALAGEDDDAVKTAFEKLNASADQARRGDLRLDADGAERRGAADEGDEPAAESSDEDVVDAEVVDEDERRSAKDPRRRRRRRSSDGAHDRRRRTTSPATSRSSTTSARSIPRPAKSRQSAASRGRWRPRMRPTTRT